jgi:low temperature requirement protein LtrA
MRISDDPTPHTAPESGRRARWPLFVPPRLRGNEARKTTWLELFYDLVFAVAIDQAARLLEVPSIPASLVLRFALIYAGIWWAWVSYVIYNDRFGTDDVSDRLLTLLQMGAILVIAVRIHDAFGEGAQAFALAFGGFRLVLAFRYLLAAYHVPKVRNFAQLEAAGFGIAALLLLVSAWVPAPERYYLWGIALLIDMLTPFLVRDFHVAVPPDGDHLVERFGILVIIVLGEDFIGLVEGMRDIRWTPAAGMAATFALCVGFSIWWVYFEALDVAPVVEIERSKRTGPYKLWLFAHFPLAAAIAASGIAVGEAVHEAPGPELSDAPRLLLIGSIATCMASLAILHLTYAWVGGGRRSRHLALRKVWAVLAVLAGGAFGRGETSVEVLGWLALVCVVLVILELRD